MNLSTRAAGLPSRMLEIRTIAKASQAKAAARLDISEKAYKNYELAKREVPLSVVLRFCEEFECSFGWLVLGEGAKTSIELRNLVGDTFLEISLRVDKELTREEAALWGNKGQYIFEQCRATGNPARVEAERYFTTVGLGE